MPIITQRFKELATTISRKKGIPNMRIVYVPHPITDRPAALCNRYIKGKDPLTCKPVLDEIVAGLTKPLSDEDKRTGFLEREPRPRLLQPDTARNLEQMFHDKNYTDGLPIVLPTKQRVAEMLKATSHKPDEVVGAMRPSPPHEGWEYTVEMVAVNSVMAGAKPEYLPVILALSSTGVTSLISSTSSFARMAVVNGPVIQQIGMNAGIGALGPFNQANSTIGRAWTLISKNLGGSGKPGETYWGSQGNSISYNNLCFPETEAGLPSGWNPLHVQKGYKRGESVISTFSGWSISDIAWYSPLPLHEVIKGWLTHYFSTSVSAATLLLDPIVAADIKEGGGFGTKEQFVQWLAKNTNTPAWLYWQTREKELEQAKKGIEPFASYLKLGTGAEIPVSRFMRGPVKSAITGTESATSIEIIVVGGGTNTFWSGGDFSYIASASVDKWR